MMGLPDVLTKNPFTIAWISWIATFFLLETLAILSDVRRPTLSNHIRDWLSHRPTWVIVLAWLFMLALTAHFLVDLRREQ
jgi:succinate dehydrogenase/fumarate reductase cytochrome b subunit